MRRLENTIFLTAVPGDVVTPKVALSVLLEFVKTTLSALPQGLTLEEIRANNLAFYWNDIYRSSGIVALIVLYYRGRSMFVSLQTYGY